MAEHDTISPALTDVNEKPTTHAKKAQIVAIILLVIVFLGLFAQTWMNMSGRADKAQKKEDEEQKREALARPRDPAKLTDFADAQKKVEAELRAKNAKDEEDNKRKALLDTVSNRTAGGVPTAAATGGELKQEVTPTTVRYDFEMREMKRVLEAGSGKMGASTVRSQNAMLDGRQGAPGSAGSAQTTGTAAAQNPELVRVSAEVKRLQGVQGLMAQRNRELVEQAQSMGITLPPGVLAQAGVSGAQGATTTPNAKPASGLGSASALSFGEPATNRAARDPSNAGPATGEEIIPTGSIISAALDMDVMSDYDGNWKAILQRPFYDTKLENILLPTGTKIVGKTFRVSRVNEVIQNRMGFTPLWAIRPDGKRIDFKRSAGVDAAGVAALQDQVDRHVLAQVLGVVAYAVVGLGPSTQTFGTQPQSAPAYAVAEATGQARVLGRNFAEKYLSIVPTVTIRAGTPIKLFIEDDIYVKPWAAVDAAHFAAVREGH